MAESSKHKPAWIRGIILYSFTSYHIFLEEVCLKRVCETFKSIDDICHVPPTDARLSPIPCSFSTFCKTDFLVSVTGAC